MATQDEAKQYWIANLKLVSFLLLIWFIVSFLLGIVFVEELNKYQFGGFPLGFWIAQQGSIFVFVLLILAYAFFMERIDKKYNVDESVEEPGDEVPKEEL